MTWRNFCVDLNRVYKHKNKEMPSLSVSPMMQSIVHRLCTDKYPVVQFH